MATFLIDEDLPRTTAIRAAKQGVDAVHIVDVGLRGSPDRRVLDVATAEGRTVVTADKEFGNVLSYPPQAHAGVVIVRIPEDIDPDLRIDRVCEVLVSLATEDLRGAIAVAEPARLRLRRSTP